MDNNCKIRQNNQENDEWYLYNYCQQVIDNLLFIKKIYREKISTIYPQLEKTLTDPKAVVVDLHFQNESHIEHCCYKNYNLIVTTQYQILSAFICLCYQIYEQFIITVATNQYNNCYDNAKTPEKLFKFQEAKKFFSDYKSEQNARIDNIFPSNQTIEELRLLVNVIKHGDGSSRKTLKKQRPNLFKKTFSDQEDTIMMKHYSLLEPELSLKDDTLYEYLDAIVESLKKIPRKLIRVS